MMKPNFSIGWSTSKNFDQARLEVAFDKMIGKKVTVLKFLFNGLDLFFVCKVLLFVMKHLVPKLPEIPRNVE